MVFMNVISLKNMAECRLYRWLLEFEQKSGLQIQKQNFGTTTELEFKYVTLASRDVTGSHFYDPDLPMPNTTNPKPNLYL